MSSHIPKYARIRDAILADIRSGRYCPGDRLPIREKLIVEYGITRTTLDKALRDLIGTGVLKASRRVGTFVSDSLPLPRVAIVSRFRSFPTGSTGESDDLSHMLYTILTESGDLNFDFLTSDQAETDFAACSGYDRLVWIQPSDPILEKLHTLGSKVIVTNRYPDRIQYVSTHHRQAIFEVTERFIRNCPSDSQMFYIGREEKDFVSRERREGFVSACSKYQRFYRVCDLPWIPFEQQVAKLCELPVEPDKPVIMVSASCVFTGAVLYFSRKSGLQLYKDLFYADFDNYNSLQSSGFQVATVIQNYREMGIEVIRSIRNPGKPVRAFVPYRIDGMPF